LRNRKGLRASGETHMAANRLERTKGVQWQPPAIDESVRSDRNFSAIQGNLATPAIYVNSDMCVNALALK
jgi:hypothetical protein